MCVFVVLCVCVCVCVRVSVCVSVCYSPFEGSTVKPGPIIFNTLYWTLVCVLSRREQWIQSFRKIRKKLIKIKIKRKISKIKKKT